MTNHIHDAIDDTSQALQKFKTIAPPDGTGQLMVLTTSHKIRATWVRPDETWPWHQPDDEAKAAAEQAARDDAKRFLGVWAQRLKLLAGPDHKVLKTFGDYSVSVSISTTEGWTFEAEATADAVCEIRPVIDDTGQPVMDEVEDSEVTYTPVTKLVPRTEKVCPPSFLEGLADETG